MAFPASAFLTELPWQPVETFLPFLTGKQVAFLDSGGDPAQSRQRWSYLCPEPTALLKLDQQEARIFRPVLRQFWQEQKPVHPLATHLPFTGGLIGFASYEAGMACEHVISRHKTDVPAFLVMACHDLFIFDRLDRRLWWSSTKGHPPPSVSREDFPHPSPLHFTPDDTEATWKETVSAVRRFIEAGDIFQANLTMRWQAFRPKETSLSAFYRKLRHACPAPFGAFLATAEFGLLSASVERFLSLSADGLIETRPIKGTAPLMADPVHNKRIKDTLSQDEKELAENLMITDLMRNDLGRVSEMASVHVPQLCKVEEFAHVHHLVSSVQSRLKADYDVFDLLYATLPPGSVTGAPKHRAMEIIDQLESSSRGAYCGTLFRIGWNGAMDSSVIIRSLSATTEKFRLGAGGGITWPSSPQAEYEEMLLKAAPLLKALGSP
ncbi:anthranilate synthase component I family protein [Acetobacteraceae bacterium ESL0709]|nr:anthranilate synthase component I family protein [Acetobacteraceae bacterium ESL0697]MDF7678870.1 anthranilate synthase component I family protein [Acetobacteraceae bacterium ESL0709]